MIDKRETLKENRFSYKITKNNRVFISFDKKEIMILKDFEAQELIRSLEDATEYEIQYYLAVLTSHFKHGNEKKAKERERFKKNKLNN